jgi:hypothetical protein
MSLERAMGCAEMGDPEDFLGLNWRDDESRKEVQTSGVGPS